MKHRYSIIAIALLTLCIGACSGTSTTQSTLTPIPTKPVDLPDSAVKEAVSKFLQETHAPQASQYEFNRIDLNDDGRRDALVLFKNPYGYWCDMHGCTMLVLKAGNTEFTLMNAIQPVREPVYISTNKNKGWKDMIVRVSGRWTKAKDVTLQFNGRQYPGNPSDLPHVTRQKSKEEIRLFMD